jgi:hypothetical protein
VSADALHGGTADDLADDAAAAATAALDSAQAQCRVEHAARMAAAAMAAEQQLAAAQQVGKPGPGAVGVQGEAGASGGAVATAEARGAAIQAHHAAALLSLQQQQQVEVATACARLAPGDTERQLHATAAAAEMAQRRDAQAALAESYDARIAVLVAEHAAGEARAAAARERELGELREAHAAALAAERARADAAVARSVAEVDAQRAAHRAIRAAATPAQVDADTRERLLAELYEDHARVEGALEAARAEQMRRLEDRLEERRARRQSTAGYNPSARPSTAAVQLRPRSASLAAAAAGLPPRSSEGLRPFSPSSGLGAASRGEGQQRVPVSAAASGELGGGERQAGSGSGEEVGRRLQHVEELVRQLLSR